MSDKPEVPFGWFELNLPDETVIVRSDSIESISINNNGKWVVTTQSGQKFQSTAISKYLLKSIGSTSSVITYISWIFDEISGSR